jgi:hypothetical protein
VGGRTYYLRVYAHSLKSYESSDEIKFPVPARVKHKAITAGVVGGILFFIVAIILSVCVVKICNKKKRRKQEKGKLPPSLVALNGCSNASRKLQPLLLRTTWWRAETQTRGMGLNQLAKCL